MAVTINHAHGIVLKQVEHRTTDPSDYRVDAPTAGTRFIDLVSQGKKRLFRDICQPVNGTGGAGEYHYLRKTTIPYGTWNAIAATIGEALSVDELTSVDLGAEGQAKANNITVGSILRITGTVAADTPDTTVKMVIRVTAVTLVAGSKDTIDFEHVWTSVSTACDTGATLELYDRNVIDYSHVSEDIWRQIVGPNFVNDTIDISETIVTVDDGTAFVAGDIIRLDSEAMLVTGVSTNDLTVIRAYWGTAAATHADETVVYVLNGRITDLKDLNTVVDNTRYEWVTADHNYMDFEQHDVLRSIVTSTAEMRCSVMLAERAS